MDLAQRLSHLESNRDWQAFVEELEKGLAAETAAPAKAQLHLALGRVLFQKFLAGVKALKHFQDAFKQDAQLVVALAEARDVYWLLGKVNMVQKLLELELKSAGDGPKAPLLLLELGDVACDAGDFDRAAQAYARALTASRGGLEEASECLEDAQVDAGTWNARVSALVEAAAKQPDAAARRLLRAARIARRFSPQEVGDLLQRAYLADPTDRQAAALFEGIVAETGDVTALVATQETALAGLPDAARSKTAFLFGVRWALRHANVDQAAKLLELSFQLQPGEAAFHILRDLYGTRDGNWERVVGLAESGAARSGETRPFFFAQAGLVYWKHLGNLIRARQSFAALAQLSPDHSALHAFEAQIGETIAPANAAPASSAGAAEPPAARPEDEEVTMVTGEAPPVVEASAPAATPPAPPVAPASTIEPPEQTVEVEPSLTPVVATPASPPPSGDEPRAPSVAPPSARQPAPSVVPASANQATVPAAASAAPVATDAQIAELRALAVKQEGAKKFNDYVKTILQLAAVIPNDAEKLDLYLRAADIYVTKFPNQTEAVKAYEQVVELDPENAAAVDFLRQAYEKRRDWEKLLLLQRKEANTLPDGPGKTARYLEMARLANERVKKPELNIELWQTVLEADAENPEALGALAGLFERQKDFAALVGILEKQVQVTFDAKEKIALLAKLGAYYGDRLNDDEGAVRAWQQLLALDGNDRRAQEALKKKYLTLGRWDDLEVFYAESGKWDEFIRVLESQEAKETEPAAKISLLVKIAELWADKKQKSDRAAKAYEKVLELDPQHLRAAVALVPIYVAANNPKGLAGAIEVKLLHEEDPFSRLELLREVASIYEGKLKDTGRAFERYLAAFEISPGDEQCREDVERLAEQTTRWDDVIAAYRRAISDADSQGEGGLAVTLRLRLGTVLVDRAGRVDDALAEFRAVHEADPESVDAIGALERLYRQTGRFADLLAIAEKKRDLATSWEDKRATLYGIARLHENELANPTQAIVTYRAVLDEEPADTVALTALDSLYREQQDWPAYIEILGSRIELEADETTLIDLKYRLGQTLERTQDVAGAVQNYREILFLDQAHDGARQALEALLRHEELGGEVATILEPVYELRNDWEKLIVALEILAGAEKDVSRRVELLRKSARTAAVNLRDLDRAFGASARALKDDPQNLETRAELEAYASQANAWERLDTVFQGIAEGLEDAALSRDYWLRLAHIQEQLGKVEPAAEVYGKVLALDPADSEALAALDALYRRTERWTDLVSVFRRRIDLSSDPGVLEALYGQMAAVYEEKLSQPEQAIAAYREVLASDETSLAALRALDALFTRQAMWAELAENLEAQLRLAQPDEELGLMLRLAGLQETQMGQIDHAIDIYRQVLERDASDPSALAALERLGQGESHEIVVADILEPLYRQSGDFQKLISVYEVQVRRSDAVERKVELLHQIAQLHEDGAGDVNAAFDTYARALAADPANEATQQGIDRLARASSRFKDLAQVFESLAAKQEDPQLAYTLYAMSARIYENNLADIDSAIAHYRTVLSLDAMNLDAADSLERLFRHAERYADLSVILQRKATILDDPQEQKNALYQAASIEEDVLEKAEAAIAVYAKVLVIDPEDVRSIDALIALYLGLSRWEDLLAMYHKKVDLVSDPEEKKSIHYLVGAVYERELRNVPRAIDTYSRVLELDRDDLTALGRLDVLYQTAENWPELLTILEHEAELTGDPAEAISYQYRVAELYEKRLSDVARAVELYQNILTQQIDHTPTLTALEGIKSSGTEALAAALVLEPVYESMGDAARLISTLEVQVTAADEPYRKVELLHRVARLHEEALADPRSAFDTYARAVPVDNANENTLLALERIGSVVNQWRRVAELYDAELDKLSDDPARLVELALRVAQIYEVQLANVDAAVERYRRVLTVDDENQPAVRSLDRLFTQTERWPDLAQILAREAEIGESPDEILDFRFRLGQLHQLRLSDIDGALAAYRDILVAAPDHVHALEALEGLFAAGIKQPEIAEIVEPLYQNTGDWEKLARVYEAQLAHLTEPTDRLAMYYRLAELFEERIGDPAAAADVYVRSLKESPLDEKSGEEVERLGAVTDGGWEKVANAYADITGETQDDTVKATIGKRLARVFEEELGDVGNAEDTYRYVLSVAPKDVDALAHVDRICLALGKYPELAEILEQRVKATEDELELVELYARLGEVYEVQLGKVDDAIRAFRKIFDGLEKGHEGAIGALGRLYAQKQAWNELLVVYERELENAAGDTQESEIRAKMAQLLAEALGDLPRAVETWKNVLDLRGEDPEALQALADLYERQGLWAELAAILERQEAIAETDAVRVRSLTRRARTFSERLGRDEEALTDWYRVVDVDYANVDALRAIAAIRRKQGDPNELVQALHQTVERASAVLEPAELREVFRELGKTYGDVLVSAYDAADAWTKLLQVDPADFEAMLALETIYRADERWTDVVNVKMQRAEALPEAAEKIREYLEVATLWDAQIGTRDGGRAAYEKILEVDPAHDEAFLALEELHTGTARWMELIELYLGRLDTRETVADKNELKRKIARISEEKLGDKGGAFDALLTGFEEDYGDNETVKYLEAMAQATGRWAELIQNANTWLQAETTREKKIQLSLRLAKWYGEDLGRFDYAMPYYQQVTQLDPKNVAALRQMASLYRKNAQWQLVGQTLIQALDVAVNEGDRKTILTDLGDVCLNQLKETEEALKYYNRALDVDPHFVPAITSLEKIYTDRGQFQDLARVLGQKVHGLTEDAQIAATKLRIGALDEQQLKNPEEAARLYREVLEIDASNLDAMRGLERVYGVLARWADLVLVLESQLDVVSTERDRIDTLFKIAKVQEEQFLKADLQAARLEQILEIDPNHEPSLEGLARAYRRLRQWLDLVNAYERHVNATYDRAKKVEIWTNVAVVYADEVEDLDRAIDAYRNVIDIEAGWIPALDALSKLYEKQGDAGQAIDYMTRVADLTADGRQRVDMYYRIGKSLDEKLGDRMSAQDRFEQALDLDPAHLPTLAALRQIAIDSADWDRAARYLDQEQYNTQVPRARAKLLVELGKLRDEMLGEHELAVQSYELALQCDPDNEDAALPVVDEYAVQGRWQEAQPLAELLVRKAGKRERGEQHRLQKTLAKIEAALGRDDRALKAYQAALALDLTDQETIRGLAEVNFRLGDWAGSLTNFQKVLSSLGEEESDERAEVYFKLGSIKRAQGQAKQAISNYDKALQLVSGHRPSLDALVGLYAEAKDYKQVAEYKRQILDNVIDGDERYRMLHEIADVWADQEKNPAKAIDALEEARDIRPDDHKLLHRLMELYQTTQNWGRVIDTVQTIADLETSPKRKARYLNTLGQLYRDAEKDPTRAVQFFDLALDTDPEYLEAFERINKVLTGQKDWKELGRAFRRMLKRIAGKGNDDLEYNLLHSLGLIYRDRLEDPTTSIEYFKAATSKKPDNVQDLQILSELYESKELLDEAIGVQHNILTKDPMRVEPYHALYRLYQRQYAYDEAWCLSAALAFLRKADEEEQKFFDDYRSAELLKPKTRVDNDSWRRLLFHEDANLYTGLIFEAIAPAACAARVDLLKSQGKIPALDPRFRQDPKNSTVQFAKTFGWAGDVLGIVNLPALYTHQHQDGGLADVPGDPPSIVAGRSVLSGFTQPELSFLCAKKLAGFRGEFFIRNFFPSQTELELLLFAGIKLAKPDFALPADKQAQAGPIMAAVSAKMTAQNIDLLRQAVKLFFDSGAKVNLKRWAQGAEATAARAGLLLAADLDAASKILRSEPQQPGDLPATEKMKELLTFSVSKNYFALRKGIGVAIG